MTNRDVLLAALARRRPPAVASVISLVRRLADTAPQSDRRTIEMIPAAAIRGFASHSRLLSTLVTDRTH